MDALIALSNAQVTQLTTGNAVMREPPLPDGLVDIFCVAARELQFEILIV